MITLRNTSFQALLRNAFAIGVLLANTALAQQPGKLMIVGGALADDNEAIYLKMIELSGGPGVARVAIVPSASGSPVESARAFADNCIRFGMKPENCHTIEVAVMDDESTPEVDESKWIANALDTTVAALVGRCNFVWFTGGDQMRTISALVRNGKPTPVLNAVKQVLAKGGLIGGSSAGAAIQSDVMIGGGNSLGALTYGTTDRYESHEAQESGALFLTKGLGFFPEGIVDQHFDKKGRLGRLMVAVGDHRSTYPLGWGIDENTGLLFDRNLRIIEVVGAGSVTLVDAREATMEKTQIGYSLKKYKISILEHGDKVLMHPFSLVAATGKKPTRGHEYYNIAQPVQSGVMSGYSATLRDLATISLIDNKGTERVENLSFSSHETAFKLTLIKLPGSEGYYTSQPDGDDHYTVWQVGCEITPVKVTLTEK